jgi:hypothetical protein
MIENLWVVITTINSPTKAVIDFSKITTRMGWKLLIVGDTKTPDDFKDVDCKYLSFHEQKQIYKKFANLVPEKHYSRKNIGYIYAIENGAEWIFDTDDDNIPYKNFSETITSKIKSKTVSSERFVNVYKYFTHENIWPRGLPLSEIQTIGIMSDNTILKDVSILQFLADKDPDVDAIYRLVNNSEVIFDKNSDSISLESGTWSPFNSQATLFNKNSFRSMYLPCYVPFRMTDIWRSFVAQVVLWSKGDCLTFSTSNVLQERNVHDFTLDFEDEVLGYLNNKKICENIEMYSCKEKSVSNIILSCYKEMQKLNLIDDIEFEIIAEWNTLLDDLNIQ